MEYRNRMRLLRLAEEARQRREQKIKMAWTIVQAAVSVPIIWALITLGLLL